MSEQRRSFSIDVKVGESVTIDRGRVVVTVLEKSGKTAKLGFDAEEGSTDQQADSFPFGATQARKGIRALGSRNPASAGSYGWRAGSAPCVQQGALA
jgi:hypothetical protein